jgi:hypothetical protein
LVSSKDCIGEIDDTHVTARVSNAQSLEYSGRKHYTCHNVLATVDFDLKFTNVLAGWKESAHDPNILADSLARADGSNTHDGKFYIGDE